MWAAALYYNTRPLPGLLQWRLLPPVRCHLAELRARRETRFRFMPWITGRSRSTGVTGNVKCAQCDDPASEQVVSLSL